MTIKRDRQFFLEIHGVRNGLWAFFLDCAFRILIGWAAQLRTVFGLFLPNLNINGYIFLEMNLWFFV